MESSTSPYQLVLIAVLSIVSIKLLSLIYHNYTYWKKRGVPYMSYVPGLGSGWRILLGRQGFPEFSTKLYYTEPHARYVGAMDLNKPVLAIRDPELIKEIAVKSFEHFTDHRGFINEEMDPIFGKNLFSLRGERWKEMRITLSPSFTASKMKFMFPLVSKCSHDFVEYMEEHPESWKNLDSKDAFSRYTTDVIASTAFGINVNSLKDRENEFFVRGTTLIPKPGLKLLCIFMLMYLFPRVARFLDFRFPTKSTGRFFHNIVEDTIKARKEQGIFRPDMIQLLMQASDKEKENGRQELTISDIVAQAFIFFLAGFETSSNVMCFMIHELAVNQDIQTKLREEVDRYFADGNGEISYDALSKMEYMEMVISETLRKYPPLMVIDRACVKPFTLPPPTPDGKEVTVGPDCSMWILAFAMHRDPKYFPDPEKFDPERFSEQNKADILPYTYMPFGLGPRMCIGNRFALMETKMLIAHLLRKFVVKPSEKMKHPIVSNKASMTLQSDNGFWIDLEKRED